jgi:hypothetical protein
MKITFEEHKHPKKTIIDPIISHNIEIPIYANKYLIAIAIIPINIIIERRRNNSFSTIFDSLWDTTNAMIQTIIKNVRK